MIDTAALLVMAMLAGAAPSLAQDAFDAKTVRVIDALNCRLTAPEYNGFAFSISGEDGIGAS
ncbi:hypothetical protein V474_16155 [Novosphingobium barchaimii LL02]|uniref:Uncharacterized protein n=1 Tax=Novosphingobium barchaimii LL02 TaxID=1114963 RepID=A0A0J7XYV9_9SPHN|nr:hypothetical protein [Novosphingobium barchaimii]KMS56687.1 hypothetical protein V474_16155 [Novosphingobium barchaimii LL02]